MNTFALDKNYSQFNFEEISVDELHIISGGSGSCAMAVIGGYYTGGIAGAAGLGAVGLGMGGFLGAGIGLGVGFIGGAIGGAATAAAGSCFG